MGMHGVTPKPESYVNEWAAVRVDGAESYSTIRILSRNSPWIVQMDLAESDGVRFVFTKQNGSTMEQWVAEVGDWVIKSPHGKFWFMDEAEFRANFEVSP